MSFILDAIKKSENQRQKHRQPDVHTLQDTAPHYQHSRRSSGLRLLSFFLSVALLAGIGYWLWPRVSDEFNLSLPVRDSHQSARVTQESMSTPPVAEITRRSAPPANLSSGSDTYTHHPVVAPNTLATADLAPITNSDAELPPRHLIKEFWELPADFQSTVPDMEFSFHVYSKDPARRTIFINGRSVKEGQMVAAGLKLRVITSTGVILHFRDRFFHIDVVEKW